MAGSHVQTVDNQASTQTTSLSVTISGVAAGNTLVIITAADFFNSAAGLLQAPTSAGLTILNALAETPANPPATHCRMRVDYVQNISSGNKTVQANVGNPGDDITLTLVEVTGVLTSGVLGLSSTANSGASSVTTQAPGSITPTAGSVLLALTVDDGGLTTADTISGGFTISSDSTAWNGNHQRCGTAYLNNAPASATNPTWTLPSAKAVAALLEFKASAGGGTTYNLSGSITQAQTLTLAKQIRPVRSIAQTQALSMVRGVALARSIAQTQTLSLRQAVARTLSITQSQSLSLTKAVGLTRALVQTQALSVTTAVRHTYSLVVSAVQAQVLALVTVVSGTPPPVPVAIPSSVPLPGTATSNYLDWPELIVTPSTVSPPPPPLVASTALPPPPVASVTTNDDRVLIGTISIP